MTLRGPEGFVVALIIFPALPGEPVDPHASRAPDQMSACVDMDRR